MFPKRHVLVRKLLFNIDTKKSIMSWLEQDNVLYKIIKIQVGCTAAAVNFCCRIFASLAKNLWNLCYSDLLGKFITPNSFLSTAGQSHNWISRYPCWFPFQTYTHLPILAVGVSFSAPCFLPATYTVSQKYVPPLTCYDPDIHDPITIKKIIFGRSITKKVVNHMMLCFPTSPI